MTKNIIGYQPIVFKDSEIEREAAFYLKEKDTECFICGTVPRKMCWTTYDINNKEWYGMYDGCNFCHIYIDKARDNYRGEYPVKLRIQYNKESEIEC